MKLILLISILLSHTVYAQIEQPQKLIDLLSPKELKMHNCIAALDKKSASFYQDANECVKGSEYYNSRTPSSINYEANENLILQNSWFFDSDFLKLNFLTMIGKLNKARKQISKTFKKVTHGNGMGVHGAAYFGVGVNWLAEVILHNGKLALFCAPGMSMQPSIGASIGVVGVHTLSCKDNQAYNGGFLTAAGGFNTSQAGLPFSLQMSYSLGLDIKLFIQDLKKSHKDKTIDYEEMANELKRVDEILASDEYQAAEYSVPIYFGLKASSFINKVLMTKVKIPSDVIKGDLPISAKYLKAQIKNKKSLGHIMQGQIETLIKLLEKYELTNTIKYYRLLNKHISGCDAIGGSASIAPSAGSLFPFEISIAYYNYHMLYELNEKKLLSFASLTAFKLLNPFFYDTSFLADIAVAASKVVSIPGNIKKYCGQDQLFR